MRIKKFVPYLAIALICVPFIASAAIDPGAGWGIDDIVDLIDKAATWAYAIGGAVALIVIIIGGISYMTAGGNEDRQKGAKKTIITGLIGAAVILLAGIILDTLARFLG